MKIWADKYSCKGEAKGYTVKLQHEKIIVTSNYSIATLFASKGPETVHAIERRFEQTEYREKYRPANEMSDEEKN